MLAIVHRALKMSLFVIVGKNEPIYEADFSTAPTKVRDGRSSGAVHWSYTEFQGGGSSCQAAVFADALQTDENAHLNQFIIHSSLDMLEKTMWTTQAL